MRISHKIFLAVLPLFMFVFTASAQQGQLLYYMPSIPQATYINPAMELPMKGYMGMPALSNFTLNFGHTGFSFEDAYLKTDSGFTIDIDNVLNELDDKNFLYQDFTYEPISFGFRLMDKGFISFHVAVKQSAQFTYPKTLLNFPWKGNGDPEYLGEEVSFSGFGVNLNAYTELALGYSHKLTDNLTLGARFKVLNGIANVWTEKNDLSIYTDPDDFTMTAKSDILWHLNLPIDITDSTDEFDESDIGDLPFKNQGFGIDLGATYKFMDRFLFSASVIDLGYINWNTKPVNFKSKSGEFVFSGFDVSDALSGDSLDFESQIEELTDSLASAFELEESDEAYRQMLAAKIYLGAGFYLTDNDLIGLVLRSHLYQGDYFPAMSLSYNRTFGRILSLSVNYTMFKRSYFNIGGGLAFSPGPWQFYILADNAYGGFYPDKSKNINLMFGMNWRFGTKKDVSEASLESAKLF